MKDFSSFARCPTPKWAAVRCDAKGPDGAQARAEGRRWLRSTIAYITQLGRSNQAGGVSKLAEEVISFHSVIYVGPGLSHRLDATVERARRLVARVPLRADNYREMLDDIDGDLQVANQGAGRGSSSRWKARRDQANAGGARGRQGRWGQRRPAANGRAGC